jgi:NTP pyrophosphatase (non-canonical NTP hydrolase)
MSSAWVEVLADVANERIRQDVKWGPSADRPVPPLRILIEEVGEVGKAMNDLRSDNEGCMSLVFDLRTELIHVAAVAVAMAEGIDRGDVPS